MRVVEYVERCHGCPKYFEGAVCTHPSMPIGERDLWGDLYGDNRREEPPERCPLRKGELVVKLRVMGSDGMNRCKTCKHWRPVTDHVPWALYPCANDWWHSDRAHIDGGPEYMDFETREDFGCAEHSDGQP